MNTSWASKSGGNDADAKAICDSRAANACGRGRSGGGRAHRLAGYGAIAGRHRRCDSGGRRAAGGGGGGWLFGKVAWEDGRGALFFGVSGPTGLTPPAPMEKTH